MKEPYKLVRVDKKRYKREHILIMERMLGHPIPKGCDVHHINGNTKDNREENLVLIPHGEHRKLHHALRRQAGQYQTKEERAEKARKNAARYRAQHHQEVLIKQRESYAKNRERRLEEKRIYREAHREELRQKARNYKQRNPERVCATRKKSYLKNAEKRRAYSRQYAIEHREEVLRKNRAYGAAHREELREKDRIYRELHKDEIRARRKKARENWTDEQKEKIRLYHREYYLKHKNIPRGNIQGKEISHIHAGSHTVSQGSKTTPEA